VSERPSDNDGAQIRLESILEADPSIADDPAVLEKATAIAADSRALSAALARNPRLLTGAEPGDSVSAQLRAALIDVAGDDLAGRVPLLEAVARFSAAVDDIARRALDEARASVADRHPVVEDLPFAVVAMGKWGAMELNYYSDIDLVFVHDPVPGREKESRSAALALASKLISDLSSPTLDGAAFRVDADLRPEGATGPISRSLDSYASYYERWGEAWELQALLKARPVAGDESLGRRFGELADRIIWEEGLDVEALRSIRLLKTRAEASAAPDDVKRSRGGIRDIEFTIQLLQLVHGRFDPDLRVTSTLEAADVLGAHGYIDETEATRLAAAYVFLRDIEHRLQLWDLRQTHTIPTGAETRERIGRSLGFAVNPAESFGERLDDHRRAVRRLHEHLYFRPILDTLVGLPSARLDPADAALRLGALGFHDVGAATKAFEELTAGLSRKSRVMQQTLPLMIDWLSQSPDPDLGLSQLRLLLAHTPDHGGLVALLGGNPIAGERLCRLLGAGRLLGDLMDRIPEFIPRLADDERIAEVHDGEAATKRLIGLLESRPELDAKIGTIRRFTRRRKLRVAARDVLGEAPVEVTLRSLSDSADAAVAGALHILSDGAPRGFGVVAMGKWGGRELSYGSDLDLMYVYDGDERRQEGLRLATGLSRVLSESSRHGDAYELDAGLRPEGRKGPIARSLAGLRRYYSEWVAPWEILALVKARPAAGDPAVLEELEEILAPVVWRPTLPDETTREIRSIKARVESERIPPGEDADFHLKLGPGGLSDIEFATQLLQLKHGGADERLRATGTLAALRRLHEAQVLEASDFDALTAAYLFCTRVRLRLHLQRGAASDSLPTSPEASARLAASLGFDRTGELRERYRRHTRRARRSFQRLFYD